MLDGRAALAAVLAGAVACGGGGAASPIRRAAPGDARWVSRFQQAGADALVGVGVDAQGRRFAVGWSAEDATLRLRRIDARGETAAERSWPSPDVARGFAVAEDGALTLGLQPDSAPVDLGGGPIDAASLVRLGADGAFGAVVEVCREERCTLRPFAVGSGGAVAAHASSTAQDVVRVRPGSGAAPWTLPIRPAPWQLEVSAVALAPGGDLLVGGWAARETRVQGVALGRPDRKVTPVVLRFGPDGRLRWGRSVDAVAMGVNALAVARDTVVAAVQFASDATFAGETVHGPRDFPMGALLGFAADGAPAWIRALDPDHLPTGLAGDAAGRLAVIGGGTGCSTPWAQLRDAGGALRWEKPLPFACTPEFFERPVALAPDGGVLVGGLFEGTADLGLGPVTAAGVDAFVVELAP